MSYVLREMRFEFAWQQAPVKMCFHECFRDVPEIESFTVTNLRRRCSSRACCAREMAELVSRSPCFRDETREREWRVEEFVHPGNWYEESGV